MSDSSPHSRRWLTTRQEHHFYVDTKTKRSIWVHPYDDPEYLESLPDTHPAHPNSKEAQAIRQHAEAERVMMKQKSEQGAPGNQQTKGKAVTGNRNWFQRQKDDLIGTKEERAKAKEDKRKKREEEEKAYVVSGIGFGS